MNLVSTISGILRIRILAATHGEKARTWTSSTSLLGGSDYLDMIYSQLPNWLDDAKDLSDNRAKWNRLNKLKK